MVNRRLKRANPLYSQKYNNRINIIMAIIFLLTFLVIYKLYDLQIRNFDLYSTLASSQQQVFSQLEPDRGDIYIRNYSNKDSEKLYPFATDKDFAFVFAIPKDVQDSDDLNVHDPEELSEILYEVFKEEDVIKEVEQILDEEEKQKKEEELAFVETLPAEEREAKRQEVLNKYATLDFNPEYQEIREIKKEKEIEDRKEKIIDEYKKIFNKKNDPYEPLEKKVDDDKLLELYARLGSKYYNIATSSDLEIKNGKVVIKGDSDQKPITIKGIGYKMNSYRYYPEGNIGSHILGFTREIKGEKHGNYGLEGFFDEELFGSYGSIYSERSADRNVIIVNDRKYTKPKNGVDLVLTIDRSVQFMACQKLKESVEVMKADSGSVIIMDPYTGAIIAMCVYPDFDPNNYQEVEDVSIYNNKAIFDQYEPGSVFKTITMAAAINEGAISPNTTYVDQGFVMIDEWPKPIKNSDYESKGGHGLVDMNYVLEKSLNTGAIYAMEQIGPNKFAEYVKNFGFGEKLGIELETESAGNIKNLEGDKVHEIYAATASFGQGLTVTPLQMITAYGVFANGGYLMQPHIVSDIIYQDGTKEKVQPRKLRRVISERTSSLISGMLANVVEGGHASLAAVKGYYVGGKTGTAQVASASGGYGSETIQTFVGYAPVDDPKFVMLTKLDNPKNSKYAASSAAPLFGDIAEFLLNYYQIPKERD